MCVGIPEFDAEHHLLSDKILGVFHYDFDSGTSFPSKPGRQGEALPVSFKTLRLAVKWHFEGVLHRKKKSKKKQNPIHSRKDALRQRTGWLAEFFELATTS